nr:hypothetical protein [uncultured Anaerostipes sp.]
MREKSKKDNSQLKRLIKYIFLCILLAFVVLGAFPVVLSLLVYNDKVLSCMPGSQSDWFGFWATHIGSCVSIYVAFSSYRQARLHKEEKEQMAEDQKRLIYLLLDVNFEILGIDIKFPLSRDIFSNGIVFVESSNERITEPQIVRIEIEVLNKSFSFMENIDISEIEIIIGEKPLIFHKESLNRNSKLIQNRNKHTYFIIDCKVDRNGRYFKYLSAFYLYNNRFFPGCEQCNILLKGVRIEQLKRRTNYIDMNIEVLAKNNKDNFRIQSYEFN